MQLTTILVRQGEQSPGEDWEAIHDLEEHGAGIGILKRRVKIGWELLVEFKVTGIVWRRCLVGILDPTAPGVNYVIMPQFFEMLVESVIALYTTEVTGGFPLLTVAVMTGNTFIPPLRVLAAPAYEARQQQLIEKRGALDLDWGVPTSSGAANITFDDVDLSDDDIDMPDGDIDISEFTPPDEDDKPSAFDNWEWMDEPDNEG